MADLSQLQADVQALQQAGAAAAQELAALADLVSQLQSQVQTGGAVSQADIDTLAQSVSAVSTALASATQAASAAGTTGTAPPAGGTTTAGPEPAPEPGAATAPAPGVASATNAPGAPTPRSSSGAEPGSPESTASGSEVVGDTATGVPDQSEETPPGFDPSPGEHSPGG